MTSRKLALLLTAGVSAWAMQAMDVANAQPAESGVEQVVVTGSRIKRDGYDQPTPVAVATIDSLLAAAPSDIATGLNQLPQLSSSTNRTTCCGSQSSGNFLNLRALGTNRTLILLDGDRLTPTTEAGVVDVNLLPELLVQRVDIVTGGASAVYGSDAVSGVVNYVIDRKFTGFKAVVQGGISTYGDDQSFKIGVADGFSFAGDKGHFLISAQHYKQAGIKTLYDRPETHDGHFTAGNGTTVPYYGVNGAVQSGMTNGGIITTPGGNPVPDATNPLAGLLFLPNGGTRQAVLGTVLPGSPTGIREGGDGGRADAAQPAATVRTDKLYSRLSYELTPNISAYARLNLAESRTVEAFSVERTIGATAFTIYSGNPFLPASVQAAMTANNLSQFSLGRFNRDFGRETSDYYNRTFDVATGLEGTWRGLTWQANYSRGETMASGKILNSMNISHTYAAADAVKDPSNGQTVCRVTLTNPGVYPGCVPINLFGEGSPSEAALQYVTGTAVDHVRNTQDVYTAGVQGTAFTLPAGDVSFAFGAEYRTRSLREGSTPTAVSQIQGAGIRGLPTAICPTVPTCRFGGYTQGNFGEASAADDVKEVYGEAVVPLLKDIPLVQSLELNIAARYTDYKYSGGVNTWKIGGTWQVFDDLRFRAAQSRDIRAPNLFELFQGPQIGFNSDLSGQTGIIVVTKTQGNPNLRPEKSDTTTVGAVYQPSWFPGFSASVDYFDINIDQALDTTTPSQTLSDCNHGSAAACALITRDGNGVIQQLIIQRVNLDKLRTSGVDFDATYSTQVGEGQLTFHLAGTNLQSYTQTAGAVTHEFVGLVATSDISVGPHWRGNLSATYSWGDFELFAQERVTGPMRRRATDFSQTFVDPQLPAVIYTDFTATWKIPEDGMAIYGTVNNIFDRNPPFAPTTIQPGLSLPTAIPYYLWEDRYFTAGVRFDL